MAPRLSLSALVLLGQSGLFAAASTQIPNQAQLINQKSFNVLNATLPPYLFNATNVPSEPRPLCRCRFY